MTGERDRVPANLAPFIVVGTLRGPEGPVVQTPVAVQCDPQ